MISSCKEIDDKEFLRAMAEIPAYSPTRLSELCDRFDAPYKVISRKAKKLDDRGFIEIINSDAHVSRVSAKGLEFAGIPHQVDSWDWSAGCV